MRERIGNLARGRVDYGKSTLLVSVGSVTETVMTGTVAKGSFELSNSAGLTAMKGLVHATDSRVRIWDDRFVSGSVHIRYEVDARFEQPGTRIEGEFQIISSCGELGIPFCFTVEVAETGNVREIGSLEEFTELARTDEASAFAMFTAPGFIHVPFMKNGNFRVLYSGLVQGAGKRIALEEFLTGTGAKEPVHLTVNTTPRTFVYAEGQIMDSISVRRSTWGYTALTVRADAPFVVFDKESFTAEDFVDDVLKIRYSINPNALHSGKNFSRITIESPEKTYSVEVEVHTPGNSDAEDIIARQAYINYEEYYLQYHFGDANDRNATAGSQRGALAGIQRNLLAGMQSELTRMRSQGLPTSDLVLLQHAEVYALQGRVEQARSMLEEVSGNVSDLRMNDPAAYCYFLYVNSLVNPGEAQTKILIQTLLSYAESPMLPDDIIISLLLRVDPNMNSNPSMKLSQMKSWYRMGCRSDCLFMEAAHILDANPELLRVLEPFEEQVISYGAKNGLIGERFGVKLATVAVHMKTTSPNLLKSLMTVCDEYPTKELAIAICAQLMASNRREPEYFRWYRLGVEYEVRLTGLYEFFLYSMPEDYLEEWPRIVLLYFSYNIVLDEVAGSRLYRYVLDHPDSDPELYSRYQEHIETFVINQLHDGRINRNLAVLYEEYLREDMIDPEAAAKLPEIVYANIIRCSDSRIVRAVVCYEELQEECVVEFNDGIAYAPIFTDSARVLMQDLRGNRYDSVAFTVRPLMNSQPLQRMCRELAPQSAMVVLASCTTALAMAERQEGMRALRPKDIVRIQRLMRFKNLHPEFRKKLFSSLTDWHLENPEAQGSADFLISVDKNYLDPSERFRVIEMMIEKEYIPEAWRLVEQFGASGIDGAKLLELTDKMISERLFACDERVLDMAQICYRKNCLNPKVVEYLCLHANASSEVLYNLKKLADESLANTHNLEERLLAQMLFTGKTDHLDEVFRAYVSKASCDELILRAFLVVKSWLFMTKAEPIDPEIEQYMVDMVDGHMQALPDICLIALSYSASLRAKTLTPGEIDLCEQMISKLYFDGYLFEYFGQFGKDLSLPEDLSDKVIVEYRGVSGRELRILWSIEGGEENSNPIPEVFDGIYAIALPLLYGEKIEYTIRETSVSDTLYQGSVRFKGRPSMKSQTRTAYMNRILSAMSGGRDEELEHELIGYATRDALIDKWFTPVD